MARDFLEHIVSVEPTGPYVLAGYSGGGTVAFEMARQLLARGAKVGAVLLLDSFCPLPPPAGLAWRLGVHIDGLREEGSEYLRRRVRARLKQQRRALARHVLKQGNSSARHRSLYEQTSENWRLIEQSYRPEPIALGAFLFRVDPPDPDDTRYLAERYGRWAELLTLGVETFVVPGTHVSMCEEPNVQLLAQRIKSALCRTGRSALAVDEALVAGERGL
jgi:thioesterase domain-containing protein